jgi:hypothetical protein
MIAEPSEGSRSQEKTVSTAQGGPPLMTTRYNGGPPHRCLEAGGVSMPVKANATGAVTLPAALWRAAASNQEGFTIVFPGP